MYKFSDYAAQKKLPPSIKSSQKRSSKISIPSGGFRIAISRERSVVLDADCDVASRASYHTLTLSILVAQAEKKDGWQGRG